jgi:hypothetical protein
VRSTRSSGRAVSFHYAPAGEPRLGRTGAVAAGSSLSRKCSRPIARTAAHTVPVWFRWTDDAFEVVIAKGDVKLRHLARDPQCVLVVFEIVRPFRGLEVRGVGELVEGDDVTSARAAIAGRYLGVGTASALPLNCDPRPGCCFGWSPTARGCGICRESCPGDRPRQHRAPAAGCGLSGCDYETDARRQARRLVRPVPGGGPGVMGDTSRFLPLSQATMIRVARFTG